MKINQLQIGHHKTKKRIGRGIAAGQGKTSGRGTKGQNSRAGSSRRPGFEGGQNPIMQRLPKLRGFNSHKVPNEVVVTGQLDVLKLKNINNKSLAEAGLVKSEFSNIKLIVKGDITSAMHVKLQFASQHAIDLIQKKGGTFEKTIRNARSATAKKSVQ